MEAHWLTLTDDEHPGYRARVLADSVSPAGARLTTMELTFPRFILAEINTHRMFSRNSASSRAIPTAKLTLRATENPVLPVNLAQNQPGMQAGTFFTEEAMADFTADYLALRDAAVDFAAKWGGIAHKQWVNRVLEPWLWHTAIVTATEWANFFWLRCRSDAQPEMQVIARLAARAWHESEPTPVGLGGWHLPLLDEVDKEAIRDLMAQPHLYEALVSAARCARVSYLTHAGGRNVTEDLALAEKLQRAGHWSPFEHPAQAELYSGPFIGNLRGWTSLRKQFRAENRPTPAADWHEYCR